MYIFQPDRFLLHAFVQKHASKFWGKMLDIGGGNRRYASLFRHCEYGVLDTNTDAEPDILASVEAIPANNSSYDCILCTQVLGDAWDPSKAVEEMSRILKPRGLLLLTEALYAEEHDEPHDYWRFTQFAWKKLLEPHFEILVLEPRGGYWTLMAQQGIRYRIERHRLYQRPLLGRLFNICATMNGRFCLWLDGRSSNATAKKFPIGYNILAVKR